METLVTRRGFFARIGAALVAARVAPVVVKQITPCFHPAYLGDRLPKVFVMDSMTSYAEHLMQKKALHARLYGASPERIVKILNQPFDVDTYIERLLEKKKGRS